MVRGLGIALLVFVALGVALAGPAAAAQTGGVSTDAADLGLVSVDAPDEVAYNETLTLAYTVENRVPRRGPGASSTCWSTGTLSTATRT